MRDTKIVATLGPASDDEAILRQMLIEGVNVVRINFSHGTAQDQIDRVTMVRRLADELALNIGVLADLQGPKIRIAKFENDSIVINNGDTITFDSNPDELGTQERVGLDYPQLIKDVKNDDILLLDDGKIRVKITEVFPDRLACLVEQGGKLSNRKGINKLGGGLSAAALTSKDIADIQTAAAFDADFIAVSFPKNQADIVLARHLAQNAGSKALIIAKIERAEAIDNLKELIEASDGIMVARGDLAVEVGDAKVPGLQKRMIAMARELNKITITATQMMESMINSHVPTRAEVSDVANAVLDGTDAVMLSAETAAGSYPVQTVRAMAQVCEQACLFAPIDLSNLDTRTFNRVDEGVSMAAVFAAHHLNAKAIVVMTESGNTALWMSRLNTGVPIYAFSTSDSTLRRMSIFREVTVFKQNIPQLDRDSVIQHLAPVLQQKKLVKEGDVMVFTCGSSMGKVGGSDTILIHRVS